VPAKKSFKKSSKEAAIPPLPENSKWTFVHFRRRDTNGHRIWAVRCDCQPPDGPCDDVREDHLVSGRSLRCRRCATASRWGWGIGGARYHGRRETPSETPKNHQNAHKNAEIDASVAEAPKLVLIVQGGTHLAINKCPHGVYLTQTDLESGAARYCCLCTPPPVDTRPVFRPSTSKTWELKLKYADLDDNRGMSLRDSAGTLGKNLICGGGVATGNFNEWRTQDSDSGMPARRRSAAGRDKIHPSQNPNVDVDDEGQLPPAPTHSTKSGRGDKELQQFMSGVDRGIDRRKIVRVEDTAPFDDPSEGQDGD
jgi:hypothetical protein